MAFTHCKAFTLAARSTKDLGQGDLFTCVISRVLCYSASKAGSKGKALIKTLIKTVMTLKAKEGDAGSRQETKAGVTI